MSKVSELQQKYNLFPDNYFSNDVNPKKTELDRQKQIMEEIGSNTQWSYDKPKVKALKIKWRYRIEPKCDGFVGLNFAPDIWIEILDNLLDYFLELDSDFRINNIFIKYGGLKLNLKYNSEEIKKEINEIEEILFDTKLI